MIQPRAASSDYSRQFVDPQNVGLRSETFNAAFRLDADLVIKALGFDAEDLPKMFGAPDLGITRWGTLRVDHKTMQTSLDGVFAAGDIVRGASLVVWAIRDGRDVSDHMHRYLKAKAATIRKAA